MRDFKKILVANRGEIAVRIMLTARKLGYSTVAVYSAADAGAVHVLEADEAVLIGPPPALESYLDPQRLLDAARATGADAVHPGYGFLSENADFARACVDEGLVFIGPSPEAIRLMGNKAEAKRRMIEAGVPCVDGYEGNDQSDVAFFAAAKRINYPVLVKAAAGGGGRGMRFVERPESLAAALVSARSEAASAFGSDELILERAVHEPRHVEFQVFGDRMGNIIHLGERDCSVQRRHQKIVEEAPCPVMTPPLREKMGQAAIAVARSINYEGAGTVEFLLDQDGAFYFLEMNTRLQVEHPVTEAVTGLDLVELQLRVARGEALGLDQGDVRLEGHAIEARIYAEDPANNFLPATGRVEFWKPASGEGIRVDHGLRAGQEISPFYDPMIAKVIACGSDRAEARRRLVQALHRTVLVGPQTNRDFLISVLEHSEFAQGHATTAFVGAHLRELRQRGVAPTPFHGAIAAVLEFRSLRSLAAARAVCLDPSLNDWASAGRIASRFRYGSAEFRVIAFGSNTYRVETGSEHHALSVLGDVGGSARIQFDNVQKSIGYFIKRDGKLHLSIDGESFVFDNETARPRAMEATPTSGDVRAPMHGRLLRLNVGVGDHVREGEPLAVLEAMKMEHEIIAAFGGRIAAINVAPGEQVQAAALIIEIVPHIQPN